MLVQTDFNFSCLLCPQTHILDFVGQTKLWFDDVTVPFLDNVQVPPVLSQINLHGITTAVLREAEMFGAGLF